MAKRKLSAGPDAAPGSAATLTRQPEAVVAAVQAGPRYRVAAVAAPQPRRPGKTPLRIVKKAPPGGLSCQTRHETPRGRWLWDDHFDVPDEDYRAGWLTGFRLAGEFLAALEHPDASRFAMFEVIIAAAAILAEGDRQQRHSKTPSRRGAAAAFMRSLEAVVVAAAPKLNWRAHLARKIDDHAVCSAIFEGHARSRKLAFARRMEIAQAAKARQRAAAAKQGAQA